VTPLGVPRPRSRSAVARALLTVTTATGLAVGGLAGCGAPDVGQVTQVLAPPTPTPIPSQIRTPTALAGALVAGFPRAVPIPPKARITASAVQAQPEQDLLGVSVSGTSGSSTKQLLAFFHDRLRRAGFTATDDELLPDGTSGAAFGRGSRELLLVAIVDRGTERSWSVGGTVAP
jgi:hypothetical protein